MHHLENTGLFILSSFFFLFFRKPDYFFVCAFLLCLCFADKKPEETRRFPRRKKEEFVLRLTRCRKSKERCIREPEHDIDPEGVHKILRGKTETFSESEKRRL